MGQKSHFGSFLKRYAPIARGRVWHTAPGVRFRLSTRGQGHDRCYEASVEFADSLAHLRTLLAAEELSEDWLNEWLTEEQGFPPLPDCSPEERSIILGYWTQIPRPKKKPASWLPEDGEE